MRIRMAVLITFLIILLAITFGSSGVLCMIRRARYRMNHCAEGNSDPNLDIGFTLDRWIRETPVIREALIWRPDNRTALSYSRWSRSDKEQLWRVYDRLIDTGQAGLPIEPLIFDFGYYNEGFRERGDRIAEIAYRLNLAKATFLAHVAQSLCVEIEDRVNWSLLDLSAEHLAYLLDSRHMYSWSRNFAMHSLEVSQGRATPGDPGRVYQFLQNNDIIEDTEHRTILAILEWCRRMYHTTSYGDVRPSSRDGNEVHWQYEGYQPVERTIAGTDRTGPGGMQHWTGGCQGTTGFLRNVLRTINIPVARADGCGHAIPHFLNDRTFISHGDDPYGVKMKDWTPQIPMSEILLSDERLPDFYHECERDAPSDVGRGVAEAIVRLLPDQLIEMHCTDVSAGHSRENGDVMQYLRDNRLDDAYLAHERFWERLEEELARRGGCDGLI